MLLHVATNNTLYYSTISPILFTLREEALLDDLVPFNNIGLSILDNSTTLLVDTQTGERVPHWVDREAFDLNFGEKEKEEPHMLIMQVRFSIFPQSLFLSLLYYFSGIYLWIC